MRSRARNHTPDAVFEKLGFPARLKLVRKLSAGLLIALTCMAAGAHAASEPALGSPTAPVTLVEYGSLTCDSCISFHLKVLPEVKRRYVDRGHLRFIYRDFPTSAAAGRGAVAARCVRPSAYYQMLAALFSSAPQWSRAPDIDAALSHQAVELGLWDDKFRACLNDPATEFRVEQQRRQATKDLDVLGTPTFVINGRVVRGARTLQQVEALIAQAGGAAKKGATMR